MSTSCSFVRTRDPFIFFLGSVSVGGSFMSCEVDDDLDLDLETSSRWCCAPSLSVADAALEELSVTGRSTLTVRLVFADRLAL
ncbi:hypothetical protein DPMN_055605 [Dreissena polymorpha]|uniref:Uncharacterized protein n=1 Tax=Dreissena polymorpha TaxID=45954 RepID=A0A9D4CQ96_DREPO|nr:hypothetical protein DPMN_055605 [Dreissena polymorpha]